MTSKRDTLWSIQYLRALAALGVIVFHALDGTGEDFEFGAIGIHLFFVISGFLMWTTTCNRDADIGHFVESRLKRIVPIYWISRTRHDLYDIPVWGSIPLWVCLLLIGREIAMTAFRFWAKHRGIVIPAAGAGKLKATLQNIYIGATFLWFTFRDARKPLGWEHNRMAEYWNQFHGSRLTARYRRECRSRATGSQRTGQ